jgi:hypothetical protein
MTLCATNEHYPTECVLKIWVVQISTKFSSFVPMTNESRPKMERVIVTDLCQFV